MANSNIVSNNQKYFDKIIQRFINEQVCCIVDKNNNEVIFEVYNKKNNTFNTTIIGKYKYIDTNGIPKNKCYISTMIGAQCHTKEGKNKLDIVFDTIYNNNLLDNEVNRSFVNNNIGFVIDIHHNMKSMYQDLKTLPYNTLSNIVL
jgi:hypothetical protein